MEQPPQPNDLARLSKKTTPLQEKALDCARCILGRQMDDGQPLRLSRTTISLCSGIKDATVGYAFGKFLAANLFTPESKRTETAKGTEKFYIPTDRMLETVEPNPRPDCPLPARQEARKIEALGSTRHQILGCIACITNQLVKTGQQPGVNAIPIATCRDIPENLVNYHLRVLRESGLVRDRDSTFRNRRTMTFYLVTTEGQKAIEHIGAQTPGKECVKNTPPPPEIRDIMARCVSCLFAQQAATGEQRRITLRMLRQCTGFSQHAPENFMDLCTKQGLFTLVREPDPFFEGNHRNSRNYERRRYFPTPEGLATFTDLLQLDCWAPFFVTHQELVTARKLQREWQNHKTIKAWMLPRIMAAYPSAHWQAATRQTAQLLQDGLLRVFRPTETDLPQVIKAMADASPTFDPVSKRSIAFNVQFATFSLIEQKTIAHYLVVDPLIYGQRFKTDQLCRAWGLRSLAEVNDYVRKQLLPRLHQDQEI